MVEDGLFDVPRPAAARAGDGRISDARLLRHLRSFVAPIAADAGAVVEDPRALEMARDLAEAFADHPGVSGMTKAQVQAAIARRRPVDAALFDARFDLFVRMGLIRPFLEKKHQPRYVLDPAGMAGLLVFERLGATGGVDEMIMLLDRTRWLIEHGHADRELVVSHLRRCRQLLSVYGATLARLIQSAPIGELIAEQRHHDPRRVEEQVHALNRLVTDRFGRDHQLGELAFGLVEAELGYRQQVLAAVDRVLDQGGASLDFSVLTPEQYLSAALEADVGQLAGVGAHLVVDPPQPWLDPGSVVDALDEYAPRRRIRVRPPEPAGDPDPDPLAALERRHADDQRRRRLAVEEHLQGGEQVELTARLRALGWPAAAEQLMDLLAVAHDPGQPFAVELGQLLLIDADGPVTYWHPVFLRRSDPPAEPDAGPGSRNGAAAKPPAAMHEAQERA
ncbi:hypothetical protein [Blastococcus sp. KM273129]|uniref:hypothetical protein n=1 Tax=Blastococcus sp. KM273129 TaxID=2570315 RepID=UPI001F240715|nr:hypothetical protein [Blastococcus sp. KM273129]MCF6733697.1 hypothetical protein [Blastococcus sp. KM273129]